MERAKQPQLTLMMTSNVLFRLQKNFPVQFLATGEVGGGSQRERGEEYLIRFVFKVKSADDCLV